jgi:hypothetical protein
MFLLIFATFLLNSPNEYGLVMKITMMDTTEKNSTTLAVVKTNSGRSGLTSRKSAAVTDRKMKNFGKPVILHLFVG